MTKVLISTVYNPDPVLLAANRLGPERLILLIDKEPNEIQKKGLKLIKESLGRVVDVKEVSIDVYDIVGVARKCVEVIDMQPRDDQLYVNITAGRKTQALGLLFACYARPSRVRKIAYNPEEDKTSVVYLPKLSFKLTDSQKAVLEAVANPKNNKMSWADMAEKVVKISRAMFYRNVEDMKDMGLVETEEGLVLTDAGEIARL